MATAALDGPDRKVSIGRIFSRGFGAIAAHPFATLGIALIFGALPTMITNAVFLQLGGTLSRGWFVAAAFAATPLEMCWQFLVQALVTLTVKAHAEASCADIVDTLPPALLCLGPLILLGLIVGYGVLSGLVLLILPGLALYIAWWVAAPALVAERLGVIRALNRSRALTRGARWKVLGIELILLIATWIVGAAFLAAGFRSTSGPYLEALPSTDARGIAILLVTLVTSTIVSAIYGVMHASCYVELREWKEGPATDPLAEVFR